MKFYIGQQFTNPPPPEVAFWCKQNNAHVEKNGDIRTIVPNELPELSVQTFDDFMEEHLKAERVARGYTVREPGVYLNSSNPRWKQDALDWIAHLDAVMEYGLSVMNTYSETGVAPDLESFKQNIPVITWTYND